MGAVWNAGEYFHWELGATFDSCSTYVNHYKVIGFSSDRFCSYMQQISEYRYTRVD